MIQIAWHTGTRLSDTTGFKREWVDLKNEMITYVPNKTRGHGTVVRIPIEPVELFPAMEELLARDAGAYLFPDMQQKYHRHGAAGGHFSQDFKRILEAAGVDSTKTFHCLRNSFASRVVNSCGNPIIAASMTGHKNLQTLQGYANISDDTKRKAIASATMQQLKEYHDKS